jgi:hypothetical protein
MGQLEEIIEGWKNLTFPSLDVEAIAKKRMTICVSNECGKFRKNRSCAMCGCYMPAKVRSPKSHCILKKW